MTFSHLDVELMRRAFALARRGEGGVEPNPMVGCLIARETQVLGEGWHEQFGGPHAEVNALAAAGEAANDATMYVTLEPCCHQGKTPPCTQAVLSAGIRRVAVAQRDPFPQVDGGGIRRLREAGIQVDVGLLENEAKTLTAPYRKLIDTGHPWVIAKWAMTLDGKIAASHGDSRWISNEASRRVVHRIRGRVDAIMVGRRTAAADDPLLTARPPGPRTAARIVLDSNASLCLQSQMVRTARQIPTLVTVGPQADHDAVQRLRDDGCDVLTSPEGSPTERLTWLLKQLGKRRMTNVLVEGGGTLLGTLLDARSIDEIHAFIAPKIVGGVDAQTALAGIGFANIADALRIHDPIVEQLDGDVYIHGRLR
ncbi:MAG: bifunctional diaminohydroxyphosphoribosylaminopyrimidine deaminase/5-amino-6-(5-phosphoribosylamino)uracil reductase RibD [Pirellulaceae bacterium]